MTNQPTVTLTAEQLAACYRSFNELFMFEIKEAYIATHGSLDKSKDSFAFLDLMDKQKGNMMDMMASKDGGAKLINCITEAINDADSIAKANLN